MLPRLEDMTLREKIGQTVCFRHHYLYKIKDYEEYFSKNPVGFLWPMAHDKEYYKEFQEKKGNPELLGLKDNMFIDVVNEMSKYMRIPVMPVTDASQGIAKSMFDGHGALPTVLGLGATDDPELAYKYANLLGQDLSTLGFRWLWSPVCDNSGKYLGTRNFGCEPEHNKKMLTAFINGLQNSGVAGSAKHFPGADPYEYRDSHFCTASMTLSLEEWEATQGKEFQACIDAGVASIMVGHKTFRAVDDTRVNGALLPSTISYKIVTGLLKEKMGFKGVVVSDDMSMKALTAIYPHDKLYIEMLKAGIDVVLGPLELDYIDIVEKAVLSGELSESRIDDACARILAMKEKYGSLQPQPVPYLTEEKRDGIKAEMEEFCTEVAKKGLTLTANHLNLIPVKKEEVKNVKIFYIGYSDLCFDNLKYMVDEFEKHGATCSVKNGIDFSDPATLKDYDLVVYATYVSMHAPAGGQFFFGKECRMMFNVMTENVERSVAVSFANTDVYFNYFTAAPAYVNCYSLNPESIRGFVKGLYGEIEFNSYNPCPLNPITKTDEIY